MTDPVSSQHKQSLADGWRRANGVLLLRIAGSFLITSLVVVTLLPETWDHASGPLSGFTNAVATVVPSIHKYSNNSIFPRVTETYLALVWIASMATVVVLSNQRYPLDERKRIPRKGRWIVVCIYAIAAVTIVLSQFVGFEYSAESLAQYTLGSIVRRAVSTSKWWLGLFGTALYVLTSLLGVVGIVGLRNFRRLWLSGSK